MESIVRQRDMYRVLLTQTGESPLPVPSPQSASTPVASSSSASATQQSPVSVTQSPRIDYKHLHEAKEALSELKEQFSLYRREKAENDKWLF